MNKIIKKIQGWSFSELMNNMFDLIQILILIYLCMFTYQILDVVTTDTLVILMFVILLWMYFTYETLSIRKYMEMLENKQP